MSALTIVPSLTIVRIASAGGPYLAGHLVSLAFDDPTIARLLPHERLSSDAGPPGAIVPESISAVVLFAAEPYVPGDVLTLSFLDPAIARVHHAVVPGAPPFVDTGVTGDFAPQRALVPPTPTLGTAPRTTDAAAAPHLVSDAPVRHEAPVEMAARLEITPRSEVPVALDEGPIGDTSMTRAVPVASGTVDVTATDLQSRGDVRATRGPRTDPIDGTPGTLRLVPKPALEAARPPLRDDQPLRLALRLAWSAQRAARFVQVVDKLFTVDRLGWYRHVLATRLLIAEELVDLGGGTSHEATVARASASLRLVRTAGLEALGAPLLAAYLPGFAVSADWLPTLGGGALAPSFARLCEELAHADETDPQTNPSATPEYLVGTISKNGIVDSSRVDDTLDATLPRLIPAVASDPEVTSSLERYRDTLLELFAQIAPAPSAVRVRQMAQPNPVLDDRLWHVVGTVQQSLVPLEPATEA